MIIRIGDDLAPRTKIFKGGKQVGLCQWVNTETREFERVKFLAECYPELTIQDFLTKQVPEYPLDPDTGKPPTVKDFCDQILFDEVDVTGKAFFQA
jgi:hypothetical protein